MWCSLFSKKKRNENYAMKIIPFLNKDKIEYYQKILNTLFNIKSEYVINKIL